MTTDDPFFDPDGSSDSTVLKPRPGGKGPSGPAQRPPPPPPPGPPGGHSGGSGGRVAHSISTPGLNPILDAAGSLLSLAAKLRNVLHHPNPDALRSQLADEIRRFDARLRAANYGNPTVLSARYSLCTLLDEVALGTPWGAASNWAGRTLLVEFHDEARGGETFFVLLDRISQNSAANLDLLEFFYVCLELGFEGKFSVAEGGAQRLVEIRENLYRTIRNHRGSFERQLSPRWTGAPDLRNPLARYVPWWVVASGAAAGMLLLFVGFSLGLNKASTPAYASLQAIRPEVGSTNSAPTPPRSVANLAQLLAPEIREGLVEVSDDLGVSTVRTLGAGLFPSGSAKTNPSAEPLIARIADALAGERGRVLVVGHTDSDPIPTSLRLKFPSNWELSQARADAVMRSLIRQGLPGDRIEAEGRADSEPLVENSSPVNKARNRRVEIMLRTQMR